MPIDIFEFWSIVGPGDKQHPQDRDVLFRMSGKHKFELDCLPYPFMGPLKTAPAVLLYLSPGYDKSDPERAETESGRNWVMECRTGVQSLPGQMNYEAAWKWWRTRTALFGSWENLQSKVAVLEIGAYHSKSFFDYPLLSALPSSRVSVDWAQNVLFPKAVAGEGIVVCLRSAAYWGLREGEKYGNALFAPHVTRGGHMLKGPMRNEIVETMKAFVG
jgi:hypothetical protein